MMQLLNKGICDLQFKFMDDDRIDKLLEQVQQSRERFVDSLRETQEMQAEARKSPKGVEKRVVSLETVMISLINVTFETGEMIKNLCEKVDKLADTQKETDDRLNAVILMAEKYFSRNNGDSDKK